MPVSYTHLTKITSLSCCDPCYHTSSDQFSNTGHHRQQSVTESLKVVYKRQVMKKRPKAEPFSIDGRGNFLFVNHKGKPKVAIDYNMLCLLYTSSMSMYIKSLSSHNMTTFLFQMIFLLYIYTILQNKQCQLILI